jgi:hypothetical protein
VRHLATFLVATLCEGLPSFCPACPICLDQDCSFTGKTARATSQANRTSQALRVLEVLASILLDPEASALRKKFTSTVTTKWLLVFLNPTTHPRAVVLCLRLLNCLLTTQGAIYLSKFRNTADGFRAMRFQVPAFWDVAAVQTSLLSILCGVDPSAVPDSAFDPSRLLDLVRPPADVSSTVLSVVFATFRVALKELSKPSKRTESSEEAGSISPTVLTLQVVEFLRTLASSQPAYASLFAQPEHRTELIALLLPFVSTTSKAMSDEPSESVDAPFPILKRHLGYRVPAARGGSARNLSVIIPPDSSGTSSSSTSPVVFSPAARSSLNSPSPSFDADVSEAVPDPALSSIAEGILSLLSIPVVEWAKRSGPVSKGSGVDDVLAPLFECIPSAEAPIQVRFELLLCPEEKGH